jgi:hypothetical protein
MIRAYIFTSFACACKALKTSPVLTSFSPVWRQKMAEAAGAP